MEHTKELLSVPLASLVPSRFNVRRHSVGQVEELAALIEAQARGLTILRDTEVTGLDVEGGRIARVRTSRGDIATRTVVNAAGPWAGQVAALAGVTLPVTPERRHIFIAHPEAGAGWDDPRFAGRTPASRLMVIDFDTTFYFHREGAGLLFGMGDPSERPGFDLTVKWDFLPEVTEVAARRLPALVDAAVTHAWAGLYEMTPDHNPVIGALGHLQSSRTKGTRVSRTKRS